MKSLLQQMHQTYYFGFAESACILAGTLLEQGLIYRLGAALDERGPLAFTRGAERRWLQTRHDLLELELVDMLDLARAEGIITEGRTLLLAHEIRWIRNMVVHEKIPVFRVHDEKHLEMTVTKSRRGRVRYARILLDKAEVADIMDERQSGCRGADGVFLREPHADGLATTCSNNRARRRKRTMRVAVVFFSGRNRDGMMRLAQAVARGIEKQGNQVDTFEGARDSEREAHDLPVHRGGCRARRNDSAERSRTP